MQTTPEYKVKMLKRALLDVCQVLREHPIDVDWHCEDKERLAILAGGRETLDGKEAPDFKTLAAISSQYLVQSLT